MEIISSRFVVGVCYIVYGKRGQLPFIRKRERVTVEERIDGSVHIRLRGKYLAYTVVPKRQEKRAVPWILSQQPQQQKRIYTKPATDHPWRRPFLPARSSDQTDPQETSHEPISAHSAS